MMNSLICYYQVGHLRRLFDAVLLALSLNVLAPRILELKKLSFLPHCRFLKMYMCPPRKASPPRPLKESSSNLWWKNSLPPHLAARCMFR